MSEAFMQTLTELRKRRGMTTRAMAQAAGIDESYLTRVGNGQRSTPSREKVEALSRALRLTVKQDSVLMVSAGYVPAPLVISGWTDTVQAVLDVANEEELSDEEKEDFQKKVTGLAEYILAGVRLKATLERAEQLRGRKRPLAERVKS